MIYRLQRLFFAGCIVLGTAAIVVAAIANPPYYGSAPGIASAVSTNAAASDLMDQTHLVAQLIAAYLLPIAFLALAWLANRRAPWLASIGALLSILGFLTLALYVSQDSLFYDIARWGSNPQLVDLAQRWNSDGVMSWYGITFGLGSVFGPTVIGVALWRSRAIPAWAALCVTFSRLPALFFLVVPYQVATAIVIGGTILLLIGGVPAALAISKAPHNASHLAALQPALAHSPPTDV
jgi:hypothetical protein